ncbi:MAG: SGNH/GDSL hydrolase family protein [Cytophagales bacterium]|nr:SGNH/GDSL hydrolase family protein [Cytophagales bacterium]
MKNPFSILTNCILPTVYCLLCITCTPKLDIPEPDPGEANFERTIALGDSYLAGYQDGALYYDGQRYSIPALLAEQFELVGGGAFNQPYMPDNSGLGLNSKPWESDFVSSSNLGYKDSIPYDIDNDNIIDCWGRGGLSPLKDTLGISQASFYLQKVAGGYLQNLAVPFARTEDLFDPLFGNDFSSGGNLYYHRFASNSGISTVLTDAIPQNPTFLILWLGLEEIYNYVRNGGYNANIPDSSSFRANIDSILALLTTNGAKGVIANIPDFESFPFYTLIPYNAAVLTDSQATELNKPWETFDLVHYHEGFNPFFIMDANITGPVGIRQLIEGEHILLNVPLDSMKCYFYGLILTPIHDRYVLDQYEIHIIRHAIDAYNQVIAQKASEYDLALVDMHAYFESVKSGIKWDGVDYNAEFVSGGFFSLDGFHPNQKGYALIANEFIKAINQKYNAVIPTVNCSECSGIRFP